jgi:hypothetical protein
VQTGATYTLAGAWNQAFMKHLRCTHRL